uniref:Carnitine O-palmitoyltransferase 2 n=1 Tax=Schistocephalus solidus TaxID=70667 RepID=A0A0X3PNQ2_SCHSO
MLARMVLPFRACASVNSHLWLHFKRNLSEKIPSSTKFIHESYLSTDYFQKSLPHLRVPELSKTLERYLLSQKAICSAEQYLCTKKLTDDFMEGAGPQLQTSLVNYDKRLPESNYVSKIWFDMYLKDRRPLVLTHNPALVFKDSAIGADYNKVNSAVACRINCLV